MRRVATLVARAASPEEIFSAVAEEVGNVLPPADFTMVSRYNPDGTAEIVGAWSRTGAPALIGLRTPLGGRNAYTLVHERSAPARVDHLTADRSAGTVRARALGVRSSAGAPISVEGRLWGVVIVAATHEAVLPAGIEFQLAGFTELVGIAIASAQARVELRDYASEQAALRRVAVLVARAAPPEEVFAAVTAEIGQVLGADFTGMSRYDGGGMATEIGVWAKDGLVPSIAVGDRLTLGGQNLTTQVFQTGQPARMDSYGGAAGAFADAARGSGFRSGVGVPISVAGRVWGVVSVGVGREAPLPAGTEAKLAAFTELVATAIANAEAQAELRASRARIVATADETRRRIERDLHDGAQQQLVSLALQLGAVQAGLPPGLGTLDAELGRVAAGLRSTLDELREYARGIHPPVLATGGLGAALKLLARRSTIPVELDVRTHGRLPERVEVTAYFVVSEALANAAKHANATAVRVAVEAAGGVVRLSVSDDGIGGADQARGSGLVGLTDRVAAAGGSLIVQSPPGQGTCLQVELPADGGRLERP